jgi:hypothetical protein
MKIQINAAARLVQANAVTAANSGDAGKVVLWIQKAIPGAKGKKKGKAGKEERVEFSIGKGKNEVNIAVVLDHNYDPPALKLEGGCDGDDWAAEERTGTLTIRKFKDQLRDTLEALKGAGNREEYKDAEATLRSLIKTKSKIE